VTLDERLSTVATLLYPGLPPEEAYRRHDRQIHRVRAALDEVYAAGQHAGRDDVLTALEAIQATGDIDGVLADLPMKEDG
jgi:tryptophan synthase beta subunit